MRAVVQRVSHAEVQVDGATTGAIQRGLLVLLGVHVTDTPPGCGVFSHQDHHTPYFRRRPGQNEL